MASKPAIKTLRAKPKSPLFATLTLNSLTRMISSAFENCGSPTNGAETGGPTLSVLLTEFLYSLVKRKIAELKTHHKTLTDQQAAAESDRKIAWMEQNITAVMVSNEQNEVKKFQDWGLDINPHRALINNGFELDDGKRISLEKAFKQEDHPFRVAIICAMWLTGFDVPSLSIHITLIRRFYDSQRIAL